MKDLCRIFINIKLSGSDGWTDRIRKGGQKFMTDLKKKNVKSTDFLMNINTESPIHYHLNELFESWIIIYFQRNERAFRTTPKLIIFSFSEFKP